MKWRAWSKWPLLGVAATAVVLAAPADDGLEGEAAASGSPQRIAPSLPQDGAHEKQSPQAGKRVIRVELERLKVARQDAAVVKTDVANAFNAVSWYEPPPPPPPPPLPPPEAEPVPVAPPVPFTYFGKYEDPPIRIVILSRGEQIYTVSEGDVIDEIYRVERIADGAVALVYLPLGTNQSISMGAQ